MRLEKQTKAKPWKVTSRVTNPEARRSYGNFSALRASWLYLYAAKVTQARVLIILAHRVGTEMDHFENTRKPVCLRSLISSVTYLVFFLTVSQVQRGFVSLTIIERASRQEAYCI